MIVKFDSPPRLALSAHGCLLPRAGLWVAQEAPSHNVFESIPTAAASIGLARVDLAGMGGGCVAPPSSSLDAIISAVISSSVLRRIVPSYHG